MNSNLKIKELKYLKKQLITEKNELKKNLETIRSEKKILQKKLDEMKVLWKTNLEKAQQLDIKILELNKKLKEKKFKGKRGFRLSGLSIDIKSKLDKNIIDFFNLSDEEKITRILVMKKLFNYIENNNLHIDGDKRYLDTNKNVADLLNVYKINNEDYDNKIRIQKFRYYLEQNIKKD